MKRLNAEEKNSIERPGQQENAQLSYWLFGFKWKHSSLEHCWTRVKIHLQGNFGLQGLQGNSL